MLDFIIFLKEVKEVSDLNPDGPYKKILREEKGDGYLMFFKKVSLVTGGFDPRIHSGHIAYFERLVGLINPRSLGLSCSRS